MNKAHSIMEEGGKCMDYISLKTGIDRHACKCLIYAMLYGGPVIGMCKVNKICLEEVVAIRCAFDDYIEGRE